MIVPNFFGGAYNIFLLRQFITRIPGELDEAAQIDGLNFFGIYVYIILPLIRPALVAVAIQRRSDSTLESGHGRRSGVDRTNDSGLFLWSVLYGSTQSVGRQRGNQITCSLIILFMAAKC
ncbi:ABC transporter permease subunit [Candidatus Villigracilis saccharophilus]|uniref:ABC transporter permease subunit n=1 Tax=Candidatus Villigracilis saccharophilus TaxID=3140684 RepID=UPI0031EDACBD